MKKKDIKGTSQISSLVNYFFYFENFVDLAGSERISSKKDSVLQTESSNINKSLFAFTKVVKILSENKKKK